MIKKLAKVLVVLAVGFACGLQYSDACAESIASMPNKAGGKIVLTNEICELNGRTYQTLRTLYMYTSEGYTLDGCYYIEDETVIAVWGNKQKMRYPLDSFTLTPRKSRTSI